MRADGSACVRSCEPPCYGDFMPSAYFLAPEIVARVVEYYSPRPELLPGRPARFPLRNCHAEARLQDPCRTARPLKIELLDVGVGGVGFETPRAVPEGSALVVILHVPHLPTQVWHCRVVNVRAGEGDRYLVGARFEPAEAV